jgi:NADH dehydrogenase
VKRIVVLGAGFAGLWSALGAARKLDELGIPGDQVEVISVNARKNHSIRVRNYEKNLDETLVPLTDVLNPAGVNWIEGVVSRIDVRNATLTISTRTATESLEYDRLVFALGSKLVHPAIPGLAEHSFDVDTYEGAIKLQQHMRALPSAPVSAGRGTVVVVGAGLTGIEIAAELPSRLESIFGERERDAIRVVLADRSAKIGQAMGGAQPVIELAMKELGVELMPNVALKALDGSGVTLDNGIRIDAATVIWCGGMRANALTEQFPVTLDPLGRLPVDAFLRVENLPGVFAAGDCARLLVDGVRPSVMSCQHSRPMGRYAGHNVVCDLLGMEMLPLHIDWYTTILDLGPWGAVYTEGWDRRLASQGEPAKRTKQLINCERIYPPGTRVREDVLRAAAPVVQTPPPKRIDDQG